MTKNISNEVFFKKYARPGCVGIVGGTLWADRVVRKAQRPLVENQQNFHLLPVQIKAILSEGLGLLAARTHYSIRELVGTLISMKKGPLRKRDNLYAQEGSYYCSSFVSHCYGEAGINLVINTSTKNTTPEDIVQSVAKHRANFLCRQMKFGQ